MISYYEGGIKTTKHGYPISIKILQSLIQSNPLRSDIEKLHELEYGSAAYKAYKVKVPFPCCKPHGVFKNLWDEQEKKNKEVLQELSGYQYFDIDNNGIPIEFRNDIEGFKNYIITKYGIYIAMLGKSIGGKGIFFLVKVDGLNKDNFT